MGKSAFAGQIAYNIAHQFAETRHLEAPEGGPVGLFSMEMSDEQYATRLISGAAGIPSNRLRMGRFSQDQFNTVVDVADRVVSEAPVYIDQTPGLEIDRLVGRARRMKRKFGVILIVVDYLQLIRASRRYAGNRVQEIAEITGKLKELAKDLQIPVVALSQLSRKVEERDDKRPKLADLRESGSIEQDADAVILLFREAHYLEQKQPAEGSSGYATWQDEMRKVEGVAEAIIAKNRHGSTGVVQVHFDAPLTKFTNLQKQEDLLEMRDDFDKAS